MTLNPNVKLKHLIKFLIRLSPSSNLASNSSRVPFGQVICFLRASFLHRKLVTVRRVTASFPLRPSRLCAFSLESLPLLPCSELHPETSLLPL